MPRGPLHASNLKGKPYCGQEGRVTHDRNKIQCVKCKKLRQKAYKRLMAAKKQEEERRAEIGRQREAALPLPNGFYERFLTGSK